MSWNYAQPIAPASAPLVTHQGYTSMQTHPVAVAPAPRIAVSKNPDGTLVAKTTVTNGQVVAGNIEGPLVAGGTAKAAVASAGVAAAGAAAAAGATLTKATTSLHTSGGGVLNGAAAGSVAPFGAGAATGCVGCAEAAGCGCGTGNAMMTGNMHYVGGEKGDWVAETTYRYVGGGKGDLSFVTGQQRNWCPCIIASLCLLLLGLLAFLLFGTFITTTTYSPGGIKECLFWGDPHVQTFDGGRPSFYGDGEYWIVKNDDVHIQGRYMGTQYTLGLAATQKVAVGGPFVGGHTIEVEPMQKEFGGRILVDGVEVLKNFGTVSIGGATVTYNDQGTLVDEAASQWDKNIVHMDLPKGISLTVYRWGNYMDLKLAMAALEGGQDGSCGNFNGDASDDTTEAIFDRIGARVAPGGNMFSTRATVQFTPQMGEMLREHCPVETLTRVDKECHAELSNPTTIEINACLFDGCFGSNEHALQTAKQYVSAAERKRIGLDKAQ